MPLEIKGLRGKAIKARSNIDALNQAYDKFNEAAPAHVGDVESLTSQVTGMQGDLEFAANVLGNSTSESEKLAEKPKPAAVVKTETTQGEAEPPPPADTAPLAANGLTSLSYR